MILHEHFKGSCGPRIAVDIHLASRDRSWGEVQSDLSRSAIEDAFVKRKISRGRRRGLEERPR